ncbi:hypothetical protein RM11_1035 [Bartonella quintana RM-11]|nr:hypothetical protein RM11_1035 [Bartonella quintana RM-11]
MQAPPDIYDLQTSYLPNTSVLMHHNPQAQQSSQAVSSKHHALQALHPRDHNTPQAPHPQKPGLPSSTILRH